MTVDLKNKFYLEMTLEYENYQLPVIILDERN